MKLHEDLFEQLAHNLPPELPATKAKIQARLQALMPARRPQQRSPRQLCRNRAAATPCPQQGVATPEHGPNGRKLQTWLHAICESPLRLMPLA